jgi:hypothetical protein
MNVTNNAAAFYFHCMNQFCITLFVLVVLFSSCKTSAPKTLSQNAVVASDTITDLRNRKLIRDAELFASVTDAVVLDTVYIVNDSLHLLTTKTQACTADNFKLIWNGRFTKSIPPQTSLKLFLMNDATCKKQYPFHLTYNIASMKNKTDSVQSLVLRVSGSKQSLLYK